MKNQLEQQLNPKISQRRIEQFQVQPIIRKREEAQAQSIAFSRIKKLFLFSLIKVYLGYRIFFSLSGTGCLNDVFQNWTESTNRRLNEDPLFYEIVMTIAQESIQIQTILLIVYSIWKIKNLKAPLFFAAFYGIRAFFLNTALLPYPEGIIWYAPKFPSFSVPYGITRDFYYSGHTGIMLFCSMEWNNLNKKWLSRISYVLTIFVVFTLIASRVHYIIDVVGAIAFTLWIDKFILPKVVYFDKFWTFLLTLMAKLIQYIKSRYF